MIPKDSKIQSVGLRVKDLDKSLQFYSHLLGFKEIERKDNTSFLSANGEYPYIIKLIEDKKAKAAPRNSTGLFHTAFLFRSRKELARVFLKLHNNGQKFQGFSDHIVSEAIYLADPDGNGIELYVDKPSSEWEWNKGQVIMDTLPLNLNVITDELSEDERKIWNGIHPDTFIGHIHLKVSDTLKAEKFYSHLLRMNVTVSTYPGALFMSAGGYHHHIGANTWYSRNGSPAPESSLGLMGFTIKTPDENYLKQIEDNADSKGLLVNSTDNSILTLKDYDSNKIRLTL